MFEFIQNLYNKVVSRWGPTTWISILFVGILLPTIFLLYSTWQSDNAKQEIISSQKDLISNLSQKNQALSNAVLQATLEGNKLSKQANQKLDSLIIGDAGNNSDVWGINQLIESNETIKINLAVALADTNPDVSISLLKNVSDVNYKVKYSLLGNIYENYGKLDEAYADYLQLFDRTYGYSFNVSKGPPYDFDIVLFSIKLCEFKHKYNYSSDRVNVYKNGEYGDCSITDKNKQYITEFDYWLH